MKKEGLLPEAGRQESESQDELVRQVTLLAEVCPEIPKRETKQGRNKARSLGHEEIKSQ